jgi:hypothetical protein
MPEWEYDDAVQEAKEDEFFADDLLDLHENEGYDDVEIVPLEEADYPYGEEDLDD